MTTGEGDRGRQAVAAVLLANGAMLSCLVAWIGRHLPESHDEPGHWAGLLAGGILGAPWMVALAAWRRQALPWLLIAGTVMLAGGTTWRTAGVAHETLGSHMDLGKRLARERALRAHLEAAILAEVAMFEDMSCSELARYARPSRMGWTGAHVRRVPMHGPYRVETMVLDAGCYGTECGALETYVVDLRVHPSPEYGVFDAVRWRWRATRTMPSRRRILCPSEE